MKKFVIASVMLLGLTAPSFAWNDTYPVRRPAPVPRDRVIPLAGPYSPMPMTGGCGVIPCGYGGVAGGVVGPGVGYGVGIPAQVYDSGIGMPNPYAPMF